jgi:hypothetical protein
MRRNLVDDPTRQCYGKVPFDSKREAKRSARRHENTHLNAYRCPHCDRWHLGQHPLRERPAA